MGPKSAPRSKKDSDDSAKTQRKTRSSAQSSTSSTAMKYPTTPDGHYFIVRNRLWRCANPALTSSVRSDLQKQLMSARRALTKRNQEKSTSEQIASARAQVQNVKEQLGERGPPWWDRGEVVDRKLVWNTAYKEWWEGLRGDGVDGEKRSGKDK